MKKKKRGFISLEYIIAAAILFGFTIVLIFSTFPDQTKRLLNGGKNAIVSVISPKIDNGEAGTDVDYSEGNDSTVYPDEEKWDDKSDFTFIGDANGITITGYTGNKIDVVVPAIINDSDVIKIASNAFSDKNIKTIRLPNSIKSIGSGAFKNNKLQMFIAPVSLESIGDEAFMSNQLSAIAFNNKLQKIGNASFKNNQIGEVDTKNIVILGKNSFHNNQIIKIKLGVSLTAIGDGAFYAQGGLTGKLGSIEILGEELRFNSLWSLIFDEKFINLKPNEN